MQKENHRKHISRLEEISIIKNRYKHKEKPKNYHIRTISIVEDRMIQHENRRLMKRLNEIEKRKNSYHTDEQFSFNQKKSR